MQHNTGVTHCVTRWLMDSLIRTHTHRQTHTQTDTHRAPTCSLRFCQRPHGLSSRISLSSSLSSSFPSDPDFLSGTDIVMFTLYISRIPHPGPSPSPSSSSSSSSLHLSYLPPSSSPPLSHSLPCCVCVVVAEEEEEDAAGSVRSAETHRLRSGEPPLPTLTLPPHSHPDDSSPSLNRHRSEHPAGDNSNNWKQPMRIKHPAMRTPRVAGGTGGTGLCGRILSQTSPKAAGKMVFSLPPSPTEAAAGGYKFVRRCAKIPGVRNVRRRRRFRVFSGGRSDCASISRTRHVGVAAAAARHGARTHTGYRKTSHDCAQDI